MIRNQLWSRCLIMCEPLFECMYKVNTPMFNKDV